MIDTSKPIEFLTGEVWVPCRFVGFMSDGELAIELFDVTRITLIRVPPKSGKIRNKPEPKRRPLNDDELHALVGTVVTRFIPKRTTTTVYTVSNGFVEIWGVYYSADEFLTNDWRRLDGSGLWVEEH